MNLTQDTISKHYNNTNNIGIIPYLDNNICKKIDMKKSQPLVNGFHTLL